MRLENNEFDHGIILGDGGYPLRQYLITPLADPQTEAERLFNEAQIRTRNVIERTFGVWKRRFPVLSVGMRCKLHLVQQTIVATAVLHNIAVLNNDIEFSEEGPIDEQDVVLGDVNPVERNDVNNEQVRRDLIDHFGTLL
uniref:DDE Tnp4 domain-containing protein n=1 Tax=Photinus pyralis TaxID=7054 RepID=A0A1Y1M783_PHOPY